jgi:hypothetical protein
VLELRRASNEQRHRALERRDRGRGRGAAGDRAQGRPERAGGAEALGQRELLVGERALAGAVAEGHERLGGAQRPRCESGALDAEHRAADGGRARVRERLLGALPREAQARASVHQLWEDEQDRG